jgi:hypothetical protein
MLASELGYHHHLTQRWSSMKSDSVALVIADRRFAWAVLLIFAFVPQPVLSSVQPVQQSTPKSDSVDQSSATAPKGNGVITGTVVNEQHEPVAYAEVQVFSADDVRNSRGQESKPRRGLPNGSGVANAEGHFVISNLPLGEYVIAAEPQPFIPDPRALPTRVYGTTFYPSTLEDYKAVSVSVSNYSPTIVQIELLPVRGMRIAGSVVSGSGRPVAGLGVSLFHRFGPGASKRDVATVSEDGTFEIRGLRPGWYQLTVGQRPSESRPEVEFADKLIELRDRDLDGLVLVLGPGASMSGRIVAEPGTSLQTPTGLRVTASVGLEQFSESHSITSPVAKDWSFRMTGLSGAYHIDVSADRPPAPLKASRIIVDGVQVPAGEAVEVAEGSHEVVVFVTLREAPKPIFDGTGLSVSALVDQFKNEKVFWRQFEIAKEIVKRHDASVLSSLVDWLNHEDRHIRGNVAFIFGRLGDARGLQLITDILTDRSDRPEGQGGRTCCNNPRYSVELQIRQDRYYAVGLLGELSDAQAVSVLVPFLKDPEINYPACRSCASEHNTIEHHAGDDQPIYACRLGRDDGALRADLSCGFSHAHLMGGPCHPGHPA